MFEELGVSYLLGIENGNQVHHATRIRLDCLIQLYPIEASMNGIRFDLDHLSLEPAATLPVR
jgi:hypothetical protein